MSKNSIHQEAGKRVPEEGIVTEVTHKFVGDEELSQLLPPMLELQLDNMVSKYYHTKRAETVTSHTTQSEGDELL